ncbi:MAG: glycosyltransferase family 39 protein [Planctomycetota bacterium]
MPRSEPERTLPPAAGNRRFAILLAVIFASALGLRLIGIAWGFPYEFHPDESSPVYQAVQFGTGDLNPHNFYKPTAWPYTLFGAFGGYYLVGRVLGAFPTLAHFEYHYVTATHHFWMIARILSALFAAATIPLVYKAAALSGRKIGGLLAAAMLAFSVRHITASQQGTADASLAFWTTALLVATLLVVERGRPRDSLLAGVLLGLACATKYNAILFVPAVAVAHALRSRREGKPFLRLLDKRAALGALAACAAFLVACPWPILDWEVFRQTAFANVHFARTGWWGASEASGWRHYALSTVAGGEGMPILLAWAAGTIWLFARRNAVDAVLATWGAFYFLIVGAMRLVGDRYFLPALPGVFLVGASLATDLLIALRRRRDLSLVVGAGLVLILVIPQTPPTLAYLRLAASRDFRIDARDELVRIIPPGSKVLSDYWCFAPPLEDVRTGRCAQVKNWLRTKGLASLGELGLEEPPPAALYDITYIDYPWAGAEEAPKILPVADYVRAGCRWVILADSLIEVALGRREDPRYAPYAEFLEDLRRNAVLVATFRNRHARAVRGLGLEIPTRIDVYSLAQPESRP